MSMLSAQCDELRSMAESVGLAMPQAATLMMGAADTIWELRCKFADLMDEREEYVWTREFMDRMAKHCGTKDCPSLVAYVEGLEAENAKLVEIIDSMLTDYLCCADNRHSLQHAIHKGKLSVYKPGCGTILERISETRDGIKIRDYLDTMKEMGHEL